MPLFLTKHILNPWCTLILIRFLWWLLQSYSKSSQRTVNGNPIFQNFDSFNSLYKMARKTKHFIAFRVRSNYANISRCVNKCLFSLQIIAEKTMVWPNTNSRSSSASDYSSPKTLVLFMRNVSSENDFKFFVWNEPDELVALKWCPVISPLLLMSYMMWITFIKIIG